jgi:hypothetical protein
VASNTVAITVTGVAPPGTTTWVGLFANGEGFNSTNDEDCGQIGGDVTATLVQSGNSVTGFATLIFRSSSGCVDIVGLSDTDSLAGTATGSLASGSGTITLVLGGSGGDAGTLTATFANGLMTGTVVGDDGTATVTLRRQ